MANAALNAAGIASPKRAAALAKADGYFMGQLGLKVSSPFLAARGDPAEINAAAQAQVDDILSTSSRGVDGYHGRFGQTVEVIAPDGRGIAYDSSGNFLFFAEFPP